MPIYFFLVVGAGVVGLVLWAKGTTPVSRANPPLNSPNPLTAKQQVPQQTIHTNPATGAPTVFVNNTSGVTASTTGQATPDIPVDLTQDQIDAANQADFFIKNT